MSKTSMRSREYGTEKPSFLGPLIIKGLSRARIHGLYPPFHLDPSLIVDVPRSFLTAEPTLSEFTGM